MKTNSSVSLDEVVEVEEHMKKREEREPTTENFQLVTLTLRQSSRSLMFVWCSTCSCDPLLCLCMFLCIMILCVLWSQMCSLRVGEVLRSRDLNWCCEAGTCVMLRRSDSWCRLTWCCEAWTCCKRKDLSWCCKEDHMTNLKACRYKPDNNSIITQNLLTLSWCMLVVHVDLTLYVVIAGLWMN